MTISSATLTGTSFFDKTYYRVRDEILSKSKDKNDQKSKIILKPWLKAKLICL